VCVCVCVCTKDVVEWLWFLNPPGLHTHTHTHTHTLLQVGEFVIGAAFATLALPLKLRSWAGWIDNTWAMCISRADQAGEMLAILLAKRPHGHRPVTLIGFGIGARLIFQCLLCLSEMGDKGRGIVETAILLGSPVAAHAAEWSKAAEVPRWGLRVWVEGLGSRGQGLGAPKPSGPRRLRLKVFEVWEYRAVNCYSTAEMTYADFTALILRQVCAHRLVNGYSRNDWVLGFVYRAGTLLRTVAGLRPITASGKDDLHTASSSTFSSSSRATAQDSDSPHATLPHTADLPPLSPLFPASTSSVKGGAAPPFLHPTIENLWARAREREGEGGRKGKSEG